MACRGETKGSVRGRHPHQAKATAIRPSRIERRAKRRHQTEATTTGKSQPQRNRGHPTTRSREDRRDEWGHPKPLHPQVPAGSGTDCTAAGGAKAPPGERGAGTTHHHRGVLYKLYKDDGASRATLSQTREHASATREQPHETRERIRETRSLVLPRSWSKCRPTAAWTLGGPRWTP